MPYYCRLCWNSGWRSPTGEASKLEDNTYVAQNGFGHEEWLFNFEWVIGDRKFAHLQPVSRRRSTLAGQDVDVVLYTYSPDGVLFVGTIRNLHILTDDEAEVALREYQERGWLLEMGSELVGLGLDSRLITHASATETFNVSFRPRDVDRWDPARVVDAASPLLPRLTRYVLVWDELSPDPGPDPRRRRRGGAEKPTKTAFATRRKAVGSVAVDLRHSRVQNALFKKLKSQGHRVKYEENFVDLRIIGEDGRDTLIEIKTDTSVSACIRNAIGQLLEYAHYESDILFEKLVVASDAFPVDRDVRYLSTLRSCYGIPLEYWRFLPSVGTIDPYPAESV